MHPIFGPLKYPMYRQEAEALYVLLYTAYPDSQAVKQKYERCAQGLLPLNLEQAPDKVWAEALDKLAARTLIETFCKKMKEEQLAPQLSAAIDTVAGAEPSVEVTFFSEYVMVLDRLPLRDYIRQIEINDSPLKVVLVRGGAQSGKTHCKYLFEHVAKENGGAPVYVGEGLVGELDEVIGLLFVALKKQPPPTDGLTTDDARNRAICRSLLLAAKEAEKVLWIAVDDLGDGDDGAPRLDPEIRKFFDQFVLQMANPDFRERFRLMLIHYPDGPTPSKWRREHWEESITDATDIQQSDIVDAIKKWCKKNGVGTPDDDIIKEVEKILARSAEVPAPGEKVVPRLRLINEEVNKIIKIFKKQAHDHRQHQ